MSGNVVDKIQDKIDADLEKRHQEDFKDIARAMVDEEKNIVLKTIPSEALLNELNRRLSLLENRDKAIKSLFKIQEE